MKNKMNNLEFSSMALMLTLSSFLGLGVFTVIKSAGVDAYFSIIWAAIVGILLYIIIKKIFDFMPDKNIYSKIDILFSKITAKIIKIMLFSLTIVFGVFLLANVINFISSQFLRTTSRFIIGLVICLTVFYTASKKDNIIARVSFVLCIINIILFLIAAISLIPSTILDNLKPVFENGITRSLKGSFYTLSLNVLSLYLLLCFPKDKIKNNQKTNNYVIVSYILGVVFMLSIIFLTIGNLGIDLASIYEYPEYIVLKKIKLFNFLNQIENIINIQWIFGIFINLTILTTFCSKIVHKKRNYFKFFVLLTILLVTMFTLNKTTTLYTMMYNYLLYITSVLIIILLLIYFKIKNKN